MSDPVAEFMAAMAQHGLVPTEAIKPDGKLHRVHVDGDPRGKRNAFYCLHLDGRPAGHFGCHKRGVKEDWKAAAETVNGNGAAAAFTDADRAEMLRKIAENSRLKEKEQARAYLAKAEEVAGVWDRAKPAPADHPYLAKKAVRPHGARINGEGKLVLAMTDVDGKIWSLQLINAEGRKRYEKGGRKLGGMFPIGEPGDRVVVVEGFATGASVHEATGLPVAVAFDCVNLEPVARALREKRPDARIVIAADDDRKTDGNPGLTKARAAAKATGASVAVPVFKEPEGKTDFNDLHLAEGTEAVAAIIMAALEQPEPEAAAQPENSAEPSAEAGAKDDWQDKLLTAVQELNERYFVSELNGRSVIVSMRHDATLERQRLVFSTPADVKLLFNHRHYAVGRSARGKEVWRDLGSAWIEHPARRTYTEIALVPSGPTPPGVFNLWRGFGCEPADGDWSLIRDHLLEVVCDGHEANFDWLVRWLAHTVQHPDKQAEVAVVLRGDEGIGKGLVGMLMKRIFRDHFVHVFQARHFTGNFNSHLADALFLFVDEAFWAGDKAAEGVLKGLITERTLMIEPKGLNPFAVPNRLKILISSNNEWVVPASSGARRFFVQNVSPKRKSDVPYFTALNTAIEGDEAPAFLGYLLALDLSGFDHRNPPHTKALNEQKLYTADSLVQFWLDCLVTGEIVGSGIEGWPANIVTQILHTAYVDHAHAHGERRPMVDARMFAGLQKLLPEGYPTRVRPREPWGNMDRPHRYGLPSLKSARAAFLKAMRISPDTYSWPATGDE